MPRRYLATQGPEALIQGSVYIYRVNSSFPALQEHIFIILLNIQLEFSRIYRSSLKNQFSLQILLVYSDCATLWEESSKYLFTFRQHFYVCTLLIDEVSLCQSP